MVCSSTVVSTVLTSDSQVQQVKLFLQEIEELLEYSEGNMESWWADLHYYQHIAERCTDSNCDSAVKVDPIFSIRSSRLHSFDTSTNLYLKQFIAIEEQSND